MSVCIGGSKGWPEEARPPCENCAPPNVTGCKVAMLHNSCIHSVASHDWCQITPLTQSCIRTSGILAPYQKIQMWPPRWPPQIAAARNDPVSVYTCNPS